MAHILFTTIGSYGDLFPFMAVGKELSARGHRVTIGTSIHYRAKIESENLGFANIRPDVSLEDREMLAYVFHTRLGTERVIRMVSATVREAYADTALAARDADAVVTHPLSFASVLAAKKLRLRWISAVLAPISFLSAYDPPVLAPAPFLRKLRWMGPGVNGAIFALGRNLSVPWVQPVLDFAHEIGVANTGNPVFDGSHSPRLVVALFSKFLAQPQPDWPQGTVVTGFPFYDGAAHGGLAPELEQFLSEGPPPVLFTLGSSAVGAPGEFYPVSLNAVQRIGARALFLTGPHPQNLPEQMPPGTFAWPYASHAEVFPRASVIVHQGGVGTTAQGMRAGRPMLVVPFAHDQFDNAERVKRIGVGDAMYRSRYTVRRAEASLRRLSEDPAIRSNALRASETVRAENGNAAAADAIESALRQNS